MAQLDNLDIFVQVVKSGSFVATARVTGLSQALGSPRDASGFGRLGLFTSPFSP